MDAGPVPSLLLDKPDHTRLRSRIVLNRSRLNAQWNAHAKDPAAVRHCEYCSTAAPAAGVVPSPAPAETALHAIAACPRYAAARAILRAKLHASLQRIHARLRSHPRFVAIIAGDERRLLLHAVAATPFIMRSLENTEERLHLLRSTGSFLVALRSLRPV